MVATRINPGHNSSHPLIAVDMGSQSVVEIMLAVIGYSY